MYDLSIVIAGAAAGLTLGLFIGLLLGRRTSPAGQKHRDVERRLDQVLQDKKAYEDEVVGHFVETARKLNQLTERYRDVHNHLAEGASRLCDGRGPVALEQGSQREDITEIPAHLANIEPPRDYAPKTSPDEKGMLNEEFGLERPAAAPEEPDRRD